MRLYCAGNAAVKDCLEESREEQGFTPECKLELENMMERRAKDVRLDTTLMEVKPAAASELDPAMRHPACLEDM